MTNPNINILIERAYHYAVLKHDDDARRLVQQLGEALEACSSVTAEYLAAARAVRDSRTPLGASHPAVVRLVNAELALIALSGDSE